MNTLTRPDPRQPDTMPEGWPPRSPVVGSLLRASLAYVVLGCLLLTIGLAAWTLLEVRSLHVAIEKIQRAEK